MARLAVFDSASQDPAGITTAYSAGYATAMRVRQGPLVFLAELVGPTSVQVDIDFGVSTDTTAPDPSDDTNWYKFVQPATGAAISTEFTIVPGRSLVDLSARLTDATSVVTWKGFIPPGPSWVRFRVKRTGSAVTTLRLWLANDTPNYISG